MVSVTLTADELEIVVVRGRLDRVMAEELAEPPGDVADMVTGRR